MIHIIFLSTNFIISITPYLDVPNDTGAEQIRKDFNPPNPTSHNLRHKTAKTSRCATEP